MNGLLFEFTDNNCIKWAGKRLSMGSPDVWLVYQYKGESRWRAKRILEEQEVEEYQRLAGCYTRG